MRTIHAVLITLTALACNAQVEVTVDDSADRAAINAIQDMEVSSIMSGDVTLPYMSDDVVVMPPGAPMVVGIEAARAWAGEFMAAATVQDVSYDERDLTIMGDVAVERYAGSVTLVLGDGDPVTEAMKGMHMYRKGPDGSWKMTLDIWNNNEPMEGEM